MSMKTIRFSLFLLLFCCMVGCNRLNTDVSLSSDRLNNLSFKSSSSDLAEVATPKTIKELELNLEEYVPQVKIVTPTPEQTFSNSSVQVELEIEGLPLFRDKKTGLGNHLNLIVDNEPYQEIYSVKKPIKIENLAPGTHTIRAFAARPWGESFKNEAAYTQTTFNVLTQTNDNRPAPDRALLTYNSPTGTYGAQPILLDFYLTNAPLQEIAQNNSELEDWRVRATIDGTSFMIEDWQPIYLTGLKPGENWVQLELIDNRGNNIENAFNNTVRVINYNPQQQDTLASLVTDKISLDDARSIITQNYSVEPIDVEPKVLDDNLADTSSPLESEPKTVLPANQEPTVSSVPVTEDLEASNIEEPAEELPEPTVTEPLKEIADPSIKSEVREGSSAVDEVEPEATETIIVVPEESESEEIVVTVSEPKSVAESEITITVPSQSSDRLEDSAPSQLRSPWWKKILVGLRRQIEAIAKQLPSEV